MGYIIVIILPKFHCQHINSHLVKISVKLCSSATQTYCIQRPPLKYTRVHCVSWPLPWWHERRQGLTVKLSVANTAWRWGLWMTKKRALSTASSSLQLLGKKKKNHPQFFFEKSFCYSSHRFVDVTWFRVLAVKLVMLHRPRNYTAFEIKIAAKTVLEFWNDSNCSAESLLQ